MDYLNFVERNKLALTGRSLFLKAVGAAKILDDPLFATSSEDKKNNLREGLTDVGNYLNYLCGLCGLSLPLKLSVYTDERMVFLPKPQPFDPQKATKVLIVDDELSAIINTMRCFIGWPNLLISYYHFQDNQDPIADIWKAVNDIIEINPNIILMDQGLGITNGYDLVREIITMSDEFIFVANTDSEDDSQMLEVGCLPNCGKGDYPEGLRHGLRIVMNK